jgi:hypothetical protein
MQPHGISASIATPINESATFVNVMAFLRPCTVYSKRPGLDRARFLLSARPGRAAGFRREAFFSSR